jgi:hypothetical protein
MSKGKLDNVYAPPRLVVYGDVRDITQNVGTRTNADGGTPPSPTKTA